MLHDVWRSLVTRGVGRYEGELHLAIMPAPPRQHRARVLPTTTLVYHDSDGYAWSAIIDLVSDGASIPEPVQPILGDPLSSSNALFGVPHDGWYRLGELIGMTKEHADLLAFDAARCAGIDTDRALAIYEGLSIGGQRAWEQNAAKRRICGNNRAKLLAWVE